MKSIEDLKIFITSIPDNESGFLNKTFVDMIKNVKIYEIKRDRLKELLEQFYDYSTIMFETYTSD